MQNCLHEYWHIVGCPNLFWKLTNKFEALMHSTNLLHVQVARMLAFVLRDSIGKKFGRLPNFLHLLKHYFRLARTYKCWHKMRGGSL